MNNTDPISQNDKLTVEDLKQIKETAINLAAHEKVSSYDWTRLYQYVNTNMVSWADQVRELPEYSEEKRIAEANQSIYGSIHQALDESQIRPLNDDSDFLKDDIPIPQPSYHIFSFNPHDAQIILSGLINKQELTIDDLAAYLDALKKDYKKMNEEPSLQKLQRATKAARVLFEKSETDQHKRFIKVTFRANEAVADWTNEQEPEKNKYVFLPDTTLNDPLNLGYNEHQAQQVDFRLRETDKATAVIDKLRTTNELLTVEEAVIVTQPLDNHLQYLSVQEQHEEIQEMANVLGKMLIQVLDRTDKSAMREDELDEDENIETEEAPDID